MQLLGEMNKNNKSIISVEKIKNLFSHPMANRHLHKITQMTTL